MINITDNSTYKNEVVTRILLANVPSALGVSVSRHGTKLHLPNEATISHKNKAQKILENWGSLNPSIDKTSMVVGDADPVVTYDTVDSEVGYVVLLDGELYASGTEAAEAGTATLELDSPEEGDYDIYLYRMQGNFASGFVSITVSED